MRTAVSGALAASLLWCAAGCGGGRPPLPEPDPPEPGPAKAAEIQITVHVKDMTKVLQIT